MDWNELVKKAFAFDLMQALESDPNKETYTKEELKQLIENCIGSDRASCKVHTEGGNADEHNRDNRIVHACTCGYNVGRKPKEIAAP